MAAFGTVQFTGFANNTLPEVETNPLGLRVTVKPNDPGIGSVYGTFGFAVSAGMAGGGTFAVSNVLLVNRNSDILIRPKKVRLSIGLSGAAGVAGVSTLQLFLARNVKTQATGSFDLGVNISPPPLRSGHVAGGQYTSSDSVTFISPLQTGFVNFLNGALYDADLFPIASVTTSLPLVAGARTLPFTLWDTAAGDGVIELQDGDAIGCAFVTAVTSEFGAFEITYEQVDPKL